MKLYFLYNTIWYCIESTKQLQKINMVYLMVFRQVDLLYYVPPQGFPVLRGKSLVDAAEIIGQSGLKLWGGGDGSRELNDISFLQSALQPLVFLFIIVVLDTAFLVQDIQTIHFLPDFLRRFFRGGLFSPLFGDGRAQQELIILILDMIQEISFDQVLADAMGIAAQFVYERPVTAVIDVFSTLKFIYNIMVFMNWGTLK